jgi:shikimate kinase
VHLKLLMKNLWNTYERLIAAGGDEVLKEEAKKILDNTKIDVLVPESAPIEKMYEKVKDFHQEFCNNPVKFLRISDIDAVLNKEYDNIGF